MRTLELVSCLPELALVPEMITIVPSVHTQPYIL